MRGGLLRRMSHQALSVRATIAAERPTPAASAYGQAGALQRRCELRRLKPRTRGTLHSGRSSAVFIAS